MGNKSSALNSDPQSLNGETNIVEVSMRLNDVRGVAVKMGELFEGAVSANPGLPSQVSRLSEDTVATFGVTSSSVINAEFVIASTTLDGQLVRTVGLVKLHADFIVKRCHSILHHMWFPITEVAFRVPGQPLRSEEQSFTARECERTARDVARNVAKIMVCLSICESSRPEAVMACYSHNANSPQRSCRFAGLYESHKQHTRMLHSLYRKLRRSSCVDSSGLQGTTVSLDQQVQKEMKEIQDEIQSTTAEANHRIIQARDTITTLTEEFNTLSQQASTLRRQANEALSAGSKLEADNQRLESLIADQKSAEFECSDGLDRLRRHKQFLGEQKEALMVIVEEIQNIAHESDGTVLQSIFGGSQETPENVSTVEGMNKPQPLTELFSHGVLGEGSV